MLDSIKGLHIEPTNICTLKCPRCSRTEFIKSFPTKWENKNLNLVDLQRFLNIDLENVIISLCGVYGDPIYYPDLFDMVKYFKAEKAKIKLSTNGSYKTEDWWKTLGSLLDHNDEVIFGIDGTPEIFTNYRINANWDSIELGIKTLKQYSVKVSWQCILFNFNESLIDKIEQLAYSLSVDNFFVLNSNKWDGDNSLMPNQTIELNESKIEWKKGNTVGSIEPLCKKTHDQHYISAEGFYTPCCFIAEHRWFYKTDFYKKKSLYDIKNTTLSEMLLNKNTIDFFDSIEDAKPNYCTFNCPKL